MIVQPLMLFYHIIYDMSSGERKIPKEKERDFTVSSCSFVFTICNAIGAVAVDIRKRCRWALPRAKAYFL
jgi:hypothetical protein